ncbi:hypothetical protein FM076_07050 [Streptomyces albus subsp. chlorinus]|uniref:hypothetical protein n=1 Tax=Streptomyces albus TaxID=1888 RepID=UPI00156F2FB6|nr:hypothetical protein [Streptomyces albus]NSC20980.1 hypothetical protein [Streptomyces albus subsp. chlorinus]
MERKKHILAALTAAACLPYLTLKVLWLTGSHAGIPEDSHLLDGGAALWALNALTVAMDSAVVLLALTLSRPWGRRVHGALLALPLWVACGLLGPIVVAFPAQALHSALTGGSAMTDGDSGPQLLESWVWTLVYTGFIAQAVTLTALFVLYVRDRWGPLLCAPLRTREGGAPAGARWALACAALVVLPTVVAHTLWAAGVEAGVDTGRRSTATRLANATYVLYVLVAFAGTARLLRQGGARRPSTAARLWPALTAAWVGTGVLACGGGWLLMGSLAGGALGGRATGGMMLAYTCQTLAGAVLAALGARELVRRTRPGPVPMREVRGAGAAPQSG